MLDLRGPTLRAYRKSTSCQPRALQRAGPRTVSASEISGIGERFEQHGIRHVSYAASTLFELLTTGLQSLDNSNNPETPAPRHAPNVHAAVDLI